MKKWCVLLCFLAILLFFPSCSAREPKEEAPSATGPVPAAAWEGTGSSLEQGSRLMGDVLYYEVIGKKEENGVLRTSFFRRLGTEGEPQELLSLEGVEVPWYQVDEEGALYVLYRKQTGEDSPYILSKYDTQGMPVYEQVIGGGGEDPEALSMVLHGEVNASGEVCLASRTGDLYLYSGEGKFLSSCRADWDKDTYQGADCGLANAGDGIYVYRIGDGQEVSLRQVDFGRGSLGPAFAVTVGEEQSAAPAVGPQGNGNLMPHTLDVFSGYALGLLIGDGEGLWRYRPGEEAATLLFSWGDSRVNLTDHTIDGVGVLEDGDFYIMARRAYNDVSFVRVGYRDVQELPEKQRVILGAAGSSEILREELGEMASGFNQISGSYLVELKFYNSREELSMDLLKKQGPDIIHLGSADPAVLADKGVLEDLSPYFAGSAAVGEEDLLPSIRRAGTIQGRLLVVIPAYQIGGLMVEKGTVEGDGWTPEEFLALAEENPGSLLLDNNAGVYRGMILNAAIEADLENYVDWQEGRCYFDSGEFIALLERIQGLPVPPRRDVEFLSPDYFEEDWERFTDGEYLVKEVTWAGIVNLGSEILYNGGLTEGLYGAMVGHPNRDAAPAYDLYTRNPFGINSASQVKEGAWEFMEYLLSAPYQERSGTFPVRTDSFDAYMEIENKDLSEEDRDFLRHMVENAYWDGKTSCMDIRRIISDETGALWAGDCSAEDAAAKIQNRVSLYLAE